MNWYPKKTTNLFQNIHRHDVRIIKRIIINPKFTGRREPHHVVQTMQTMQTIKHGDRIVQYWNKKGLTNKGK